ncbi:nitroreductase family protein [Actinomyces marmotae]|uniref:NADPH-dependent oxidoreductase n=1 Tax=Actinomyces marmotae TaxID=2737173 RepID=A0A6M8BCM7_9ACTO|nr:nitroreductase family protein [Actinomyces marmotae]QKD80525.1 NADPH-dependent oxidoreductase [Actinomyces marmotae]
MTAPVRNATIDALLAHRTIRAFTDEPVGEEVMRTLLSVARASATSSYFQQATFIRVRDAVVREAVHAASGQPYVGGDRGELLVLVVDLHRNAVIRERAGASLEPLERAHAFLQGCQDTMIAAQSMVAAAESLGLGTCYLGSILGDPAGLIAALGLPERTFPLLGLLVGHPAQEPQYKPRLPERITVGIDSYPPLEEHDAELAAYDERVTEYYDLRDASRRVDSFTEQIARAVGQGRAAQAPILDVLHRQRLCLH